MEWRIIPAWPDYAVSEHGAIRRVRRRHNTKPCDRKPYLCTNGYLYIVVRRPGLRRALAIHRLVAMAFIGPAPSIAHQAAHIDGDRLNNHWTNLRWSTRSENERDKVRHGRSNRGERMGRSKLSANAVLQIRAARKGGALLSDLAQRYGVAVATIQCAAAGKSWGWLS